MTATSFPELINNCPSPEQLHGRSAQAPCLQHCHGALGRHIKAVDGEHTFFAWDGDALLSERCEDQPAREYVYYPGTFEPLALIDGDSQVYYYHNDVNGLPCELTRSSGDIVWSAAYDAQGRVQKLLIDEIAQPLRFQGQYFDEETRLGYNHYRYYDPATCSFISQDPIGLVGGENVYAYAPNVWGWVDPLGLSCKKGTAIIRQYNPKPDEPHFTIEVQHGSENYTTEQYGGIGTDTAIANTDSMGSSGVATAATYKFDLPDAQSAMRYQKVLVAESSDRAWKGVPGPAYDVENRSCLTHCFDVLRIGGVENVPASSKTTPSFFKFMRRHKVN